MVPASNTSSIQAELGHTCAWSRNNNQSLNTTKSLNSLSAEYALVCLKTMTVLLAWEFWGLCFPGI